MENDHGELGAGYENDIASAHQNCWWDERMRCRCVLQPPGFVVRTADVHLSLLHLSLSTSVEGRDDNEGTQWKENVAPQGRRRVGGNEHVVRSEQSGDDGQNDTAGVHNF